MSPLVGEQLDEELGQGGGEAGGVGFLGGFFAALGVEVVGGVVAQLEQTGGGLGLEDVGRNRAAGIDFAEAGLDVVAGRRDGAADAHLAVPGFSLILQLIVAAHQRRSPFLDPEAPNMPKRPVSELLLHNFPENGVKFLLHNPGNLRDVMGYLAARYSTLPDLGCFDFARRTIEPDTLIRSDFSHGVTDLLVRLPFRFGRDPASWIKMYLLVEHLSAHQRTIVPRSLG